MWTKLVVLALLTALSSGAAGAQSQPASAASQYWSEQRRGANFFNAVETEARIRDAAQAGIEFIRLTPSKWRTPDGESLIGVLGEPYSGLVQAPLDDLRSALDAADRHDVKVVLTLLDLPCMWGRQPNAEMSDFRLWSDESCQAQAAAVWRDIAMALSGHPALVGYNPLNEPQPARALADLDDPGSPEYAAFVETHRGSAADINRFNARIVEAIRSVDPDTPIHIEPGAYADPAAMAYLEPLDDPNILYSVHLYPSWRYGAHRANRGRFSYPDAMPVGWSDETGAWPADRICGLLEPFLEWARRRDIPHERLIVSEFGVSRRVAGAQDYMQDMVECLEAHRLHWAFYAFREDSWDEMDYELSPQTHPDARVPSVETEDGYRVKLWERAELFEILSRRLGSEP